MANSKLQLIILVCLGLAICVMAGYLAVGLFSHHAADRFAGRLHRLRKVGPTLAELWFTLRAYRKRPGTILAVVAMSAVVHTGFVTMYHLATRVFPPDDPALLATLPETFVIAPIGFIVQALIPVPGGLGVGELTFGGLYKLIRGPEGEAVGLAGRLTLRLIEWTLGLVGYVAFLRMRAEIPTRVDEEGAEMAIRQAEPVEIGNGPAN